MFTNYSEDAFLINKQLKTLTILSEQYFYAIKIEHFESCDHFATQIHKKGVFFKKKKKQ